MAKKKIQTRKKVEKEIVGQVQNILARGRVFEGKVVKKFPKHVVIEFERTVHLVKYERFYKKKTRLHSRIPAGLEVNLGDLVRVQECRPLSKIIHSIVISIIKKSDKSEENVK